jgi:hypothetical protein
METVVLVVCYSTSQFDSMGESVRARALPAEWPGRTNVLKCKWRRVNHGSLHVNLVR